VLAMAKHMTDFRFKSTVGRFSLKLRNLALSLLSRRAESCSSSRTARLAPKQAISRLNRLIDGQRSHLAGSPPASGPRSGRASPLAPVRTTNCRALAEMG